MRDKLLRKHLGVEERHNYLDKYLGGIGYGKLANINTRLESQSAIIYQLLDHLGLEAKYEKGHSGKFIVAPKEEK